jgi:hypothetical protein
MHLNVGRWQFVWYGWSRLTAKRFGRQHFPGGLGEIYAYRLMLGPLDIRRFRRSLSVLRQETEASK